MNKHQIAVEAAEELCRAYGFSSKSIQRMTALAIIEATIEKGIEIGYNRAIQENEDFQSNLTQI